MLAFRIGLAHIYDALHIHQCTYGGCGNAVLSGTCFGYDAAFAHTACQQNLPDGIVDFVCAGMIQVFPFQVNPATVLFRQTPCLVER